MFLFTWDPTVTSQLRTLADSLAKDANPELSLSATGQELMNPQGTHGEIASKNKSTEMNQPNDPIATAPVYKKRLAEILRLTSKSALPGAGAHNRTGV
jgi:hypothetical protein